jgi:hypothetical protein
VGLAAKRFQRHKEILLRFIMIANLRWEVAAQMREVWSFSLTPRFIAVQAESRHLYNRFNGFIAWRRQTVKTVADFGIGPSHRDESRC